MRRTATLTALAGLALSTLGPVTAAPATAAVGCDGKAATIVVPAPEGPITDSTETAPVTGTPGDDVIVGSEARDTIDGGAGNDTICALGGEDMVRGGVGDDRLFGGLDGVYVADDDFWGDVVVPGPGDDHVDLGHDPQGEDLWYGDSIYLDRVSFRDATGPVTVDMAAGTATGEGTDTIAPVVLGAGVEGSPHADVIRGTDLDDQIDAGGGDDVVEGRGGDDVIEADRGYSGMPNPPAPEPGDDVVHGGPGMDTVDGGHGVDELYGDGGRDSLRVAAAEEGTRVLGGPGRDGLGSWSFRNSGRATFLGGGGNDVLYPAIKGKGDKVVVRGGGGADRIAPAASLRAAPHRSRVEIDARRGTYRMKVGTPIRFSSVTSFGWEGSAETRLTWWGTRRSEVLSLTEQYGPVRAYGGGGNDRIGGGQGRDLLDGGRGRDVLDGSNGRDRCVRGERLKACELRR
ncbi:calcium-binding protein [Nocardioides sp. zg-1230]|uniref:calcium-binding protein n=1 Tax=Nocardioides sp. zg-1230 TaxID=2736601 RepID=UPI001551C60B|nr:calcium-binding protein [Nocardioides sp. zg-1230]NPC41849.1 hypothetical protein [Nocardioides sp. zg-1230]